MGRKFYTEKIFITADESKINYVDEGSHNTETILFLHGWISEGSIFADIGKSLIEKYRVIWFDYRGNGKTISNGPYTIAQLAADAEALLEYLKIENVTIMGYSMGALVLFQFIRNYGCKNIRKAIVLDMTAKVANDANWKHGWCQGHYTRENYQRDTALLETGFHEFGSIFLPYVMFKHTPDKPKNYKPNFLFKILSHLFIKVDRLDALRSYFHEMYASDYRNDLLKICIPMAVIYAKPGSIYEEGAAVYIKSRISNASLYPIENTTHTSIGTRSKELTAVLLQFLSSNTSLK